MNRSKFALTWGRNLFFGISWPFSMMLALVYLRSFILPADSVETVFFAVAFVGHFGILNVLAYFLLFCPIAYIFPNYYLVRFWSLILIVLLNIAILVDGLTFSSYHEHVYGYLGKVLLETGPSYLFGSNAVLTLICVGFFIFAILLWLRGESLWRAMKRRFSNPVKNWYLVLIVFCLGVSKALFYSGSVGPELASVFPVNENYGSVTYLLKSDRRKLFYPQMEPVCNGKQNPNIVLLVINEWDNTEFTAEQFPTLFHLKEHGVSFNAHYSGGLNPDSGLFSLLYSIPGSYQSSVKDQTPIIFTELKKRQYDVLSLNAANSDPLKDMNYWLEQRNVEVSAPFYLSVNFNKLSIETEKSIQDIILFLERKELLKGTYLLITGGFSPSGLTPFITIDPARKKGDISHKTSHYDVLPSLMQKIWNCKNAFKAASTGIPLDKVERDWLLVTGHDGFKIIDYRTNKTLELEKGVLSGDGRKELIFPALKMMTHFSRPL